MSETTVQILKNGPILVKGPIQMKNAEGKDIATKSGPVALCRCGHSANKPFCDGAHQKAGFQG